MNTMGVALAADSAVTLGGARGPKIYNSADKLFLLSEHAPVGIMVYGNATLMDVPWETIIKSYRHQSTKPLRTIEAYAKDFITFLESQRSFFPSAAQMHAVERHAHIALGGISETVMDQLREYMTKSGPLTPRQAGSLLRRLFATEASRWLKTVRAHPVLVSRLPLATLRRLYSKIVAKAENHLFQKVRLHAGTRAMLRDGVLEGLRREIFTSQASGVVIAGFGAASSFRRW
jgi:hypothetical protein